MWSGLAMLMSAMGGKRTGAGLSRQQLSLLEAAPPVQSNAKFLKGGFCQFRSAAIALGKQEYCVRKFPARSIIGQSAYGDDPG